MTDITDNQQDNFNEQLLDLVGYVLTSTRGLYKEPHSYGPMRMIDSLEKTIALLKEKGLEDDSLDQVMEVLRENRWRVTSDPEAFALALDEAIHRLVIVTVNEKDKK